jgi:hypothetical protein
MSIKPQTIEKYMNVMVYASTLPSFSTRDITKRFHINAGVPSRMVKLGYAIELEHGKKRWVGETPNRGMAVNVARAWRKTPKVKKESNHIPLTTVFNDALIPAYIDYLKSKGYEIYKVTREQV